VKIHNKGYTLIEVLVALFIFVILVSMISFSFTRLLKNTEIIKSNEERLIDIQTALVTLQFDLAQTIAKPIVISSNELQGSFYTQSNVLHFYKTGNINPEERLARSSIEEIQYKIVNNNLIKITKEDNSTKTINQILLRGVDALEWQFIDKNLAYYSLWPPTRDWQFEIPIAVKFTLTLPDLGPIEQIIELANG